MVNQPSGLKGFLKRCTEGSYRALGVAFLAIGFGVMKRKRTHASPE